MFLYNMANNPLFRPTTSPTSTTKPSKAVNNTETSVRLSHNTFDNSYFNFKTQRYGLLEPFFWKDCVAGDNEPFSNSHNVRSLPFASPILSPMKLNKDYFMIPKYAIQPHTWDYIFKNPNQGDDVPYDSQNLFPLVSYLARSSGDPHEVVSIFDALEYVIYRFSDNLFSPYDLLRLIVLEPFFSSGSLLYNLGYKLNPVIVDQDTGNHLSFDEFFDAVFSALRFFSFAIDFDDPDSVSGYRTVNFTTSPDSSSLSNPVVVDLFTAISLIRSFFGNIRFFTIDVSGESLPFYSLIKPDWLVSDLVDDRLNSLSVDPLDCVRLDNVVAYQYACAQYYVNPRVDFLYNAQLFRDNYIQLVRLGHLGPEFNEDVLIANFNLNGIPVLYDYFSLHYHWYSMEMYLTSFFRHDLIDDDISNGLSLFQKYCNPVMYLFSYREQLRFGNYFTDSRTQALGYGQPGSDTVVVNDDQSISVTDLSQKLVLERFRSAVAHLDGSAEDYLATMFHEQLPPDYHYPKFIAHSEFAINGSEVSNTTSDNQGNIVTNLMSGDDTAEFNVVVNVPSVLIGISYVSIPETYCQIKERQYFHGDRYDMFQPMLQYFGDQEIYNREVSDEIPNPADAYGFVSRNGEYKQRVSQVSGGFLTRLRSWIFTVDLPSFAGESSMPRLAFTQSPLAIRAHDFEFNRFLSAQTGLSLGTGFHFIMQYNNKNVDNRPMDVNPLPLYPSNNL